MYSVLSMLFDSLPWEDVWINWYARGNSLVAKKSDQKKKMDFMAKCFPGCEQSPIDY